MGAELAAKQSQAQSCKPMTESILRHAWEPDTGKTVATLGSPRR